MTFPVPLQPPHRSGLERGAVSSAVSLRSKGSPRPAPVDVDLLLTAWRQGDESARDLLLGEVRRRALRYLAGLRVPAHECEDLAQEVCLAVLAAAPGWQAEGTSLWALVFTIARNKHVDRVRRITRAPVLGAGAETVEQVLGAQASSEAGPEEQAVLGDVSSHMAALLQQLAPNQRDVLLLRVVVGLSVAETAAVLGLKHGSVHVLQHRALGKLRALMAGGAG